MLEGLKEMLGGPSIGTLLKALPQSKIDGTSQVINAAISAKLQSVDVKEGQAVKRGQKVAVIEAMKMANDIVSEVDGTVQRVAVSNGQSVNQGDLLVEMVADFVAAKAPALEPKPAPAAPAGVSTAPTMSAPATGSKTVTAPLPGSITKISVKVGDRINIGDQVLLMEAMKMENSISAEAAGTVKAILCKEGDQVQSGQALVELD